MWRISVSQNCRAPDLRSGEIRPTLTTGNNQSKPIDLNQHGNNQSKPIDLDQHGNNQSKSIDLDQHGNNQSKLIRDIKTTTVSNAGYYTALTKSVGQYKPECVQNKLNCSWVKKEKMKQLGK